MKLPPMLATARCVKCCGWNPPIITGHVLHPRLGTVLASWCRRCAPRGLSVYYQGSPGCFGKYTNGMGVYDAGIGAWTWRSWG